MVEVDSADRESRNGQPADNPLSEREMEVARLLATGASNAEIARGLVISPHTVKVHLRNIFEKLQVSSRTEATMLLVQRGWLEVPGAVRSEGEAAPPEATAIPDPEALGRQPPQVARWQGYWLAATLLILLAMLALPIWQSQASTSAPLLSDAGNRTGRPAEIVGDARWQSLAPMPVARSRHGAALLGERIYVAGGESEGGALLDHLDAYDFTANRWVSLTPLPQAASNLAAAALGDALYVAGGTLPAASGEESPPLNGRLWRYDPGVDQWADAGPLPAPVAGAALAAGEDALYLVGGWDGQAMRDEVWRYKPPNDAGEDGDGNPAVGSWELVDHIPVPRAFLGAAAIGDALFVIGGFDGQRELARADAFNLAQGTWRALAPMATPRSGFGLAYDGVALVAIGGGWLDTVETHERYDPTVDVWSNFPSPVRGSWRHLGAASRDGQLYLMGGWAGDYMTNLFQYQSTFRSLLPVITNP